MNYDWRNFAKSNYCLWLSSEVLQRLRIISFNSRSLNAECGNDFFGFMGHNGRTVVFDELSDMCLTSDPGVGDFHASAHSHSTLDDPGAYEKFNKFLATAKANSCLLDIHTHMSGQYLDDGTVYDEYWKFSSADIDVFKETSKILAKDKVHYFSGITYITNNNRVGLAIIYYDKNSDEFYHVDKLGQFDYATNDERKIGMSGDFHFIGSIYQ